MSGQSAEYGFWSKMRRQYVAFMEKQGFYIVLSVCVLVIVLSSVYTFRLRDRLENPTVSQEDRQAAESVASLQGAQSLAEAQALRAAESTDEPVSPVPSALPVRFARPLHGAILRAFSFEQPVYFARSRCYQLHPAVDLAAEYGAAVTACADGSIAEVQTDDLWGLCVWIRHADGYESFYAGLSEAPYVREGDRVAQGQTIGHVGNGVLTEADDEPHLHWAVRRDGQWLDPVSLLFGD